MLQNEQFFSSKSEECDNNLEEKIREGNEKLKSTFTNMNSKEDVGKVTARNDESALSSFHHRRSESDKKLSSFGHQRTNSNTNNQFIPKQMSGTDKIQSFNQSDNFKKTKSEGNKSFKIERKMNDKSYEGSNSLKSEKFLSSNDYFFKDGCNYSPVKKNRSLSVSDSNIKNSESLQESNNKMEESNSIKKHPSDGIQLIENYNLDTHNQSNAKSATFKSESIKFYEDNNIEKSPSKLSQNNSKFFDTTLARHNKHINHPTQKISLNKFPISKLKKTNPSINEDEKKIVSLSDSLGINQSPSKSPNLRSSFRYPDSTYRSPKGNQEIEYYNEGEFVDSINFSSNRHIMSTMEFMLEKNHREKEKINDSYNISNDNISDLKERLKILERENLISFVENRQNEILIKIHNKSNSRQFNKTSINESTGFNDRNIQHTKTSSQKNESINNSKNLLNSRQEISNTKIFSVSKSADKMSLSLISNNPNKSFASNKIQVCSKEKDQQQIYFQQNRKLIEKLNKIEIEKHSLENKLNRIITSSRFCSKDSKNAHFNKNNTKFSCENTNKDTNLDQLEQQLIKQNQDNISYKKNPLLEGVDPVIKRSLYLYKNKNCHTCSNLLSLGKTSKSCPKNHW